MDEADVLEQIRRDATRSRLFRVLGAILLYGVTGLIAAGTMLWLFVWVVDPEEEPVQSIIAVFGVLCGVWLPLALVSYLVYEKGLVKPGFSIDPLADPRLPFLASRSFSEVKLRFSEQFHFDGVADPGESLLKTIDEALYRLGRLVIVGEETVPESAVAEVGRSVLSGTDLITLLETDETWFETFLYVARHCRGIIILPAASEGVVQEMLTVTEHQFLGKTLVIIPPEDWAGGFNRDRVRTGWAELGATLESRTGFHLPKYTPEGMVYIPNPDFSPKTQYSLEGDLANIDKIVEHALPADAHSVLPLSTMLAHLSDTGLVPSGSDNRKLTRIPQH